MMHPQDLTDDLAKEEFLGGAERWHLDANHEMERHFHQKQHHEKYILGQWRVQDT
jgi:hypothetical protein